MSGLVSRSSSRTRRSTRRGTTARTRASSKWAMWWPTRSRTRIRSTSGCLALTRSTTSSSACPAWTPGAIDRYVRDRANAVKVTGQSRGTAAEGRATSPSPTSHQSTEASATHSHAASAPFQGRVGRTPLQHPVGQPPGGTAVGAQRAHFGVGQDAVRASAVGDHLLTTSAGRTSKLVACPCSAMRHRSSRSISSTSSGRKNAPGTPASSSGRFLARCWVDAYSSATSGPLTSSTRATSAARPAPDCRVAQPRTLRGSDPYEFFAESVPSWLWM